MTVDSEAVVAKMRQERRRFRRVPVDLKGRMFVPGEEREAACTITDMSPAGAQVICGIVPPVQAAVVLYVDGFGRLEGNVTRAIKGDVDETCFGVRFHCSAHKRDRLAEQLAVYVSEGAVDQTALRRHDRKPTRGLAHFTRASGEIVHCEVLDLSLGGVSLVTDVRPQIGEIVLIGEMAGRVARIHENGIAIEFVTPPPEKSATGEPLPPKLSALR
jgi:hypothetical protein